MKKKLIIKPFKKNPLFFLGVVKQNSLQKISLKINNFETRYPIFTNFKEKLTTQKKYGKLNNKAFQKRFHIFFLEIVIILLKFL